MDNSIILKIQSLIDAKPELVVLRLSAAEARALYDWFNTYDARNLPPFKDWAAKANFLGRKLEIYGEENLAGGV